MPSWCWCCCSRRALDDFPRNLTETRFSAHFGILIRAVFLSVLPLFVCAPFTAKIWFQTFVLWLRKPSAHDDDASVLKWMPKIWHFIRDGNGFVLRLNLKRLPSLLRVFVWQQRKGKKFLLVCRLKISFSFNLLDSISSPSLPPSTRNHHPHVCLSVSTESVCVHGYVRPYADAVGFLLRCSPQPKGKCCCLICIFQTAF